MSQQLNTSQLRHAAPHQPIKLKVKTCLKLAVTSGRLWVTATGDTSDYFVHAGESLLLHPKHRHYWIEADSVDAAFFQLLNHCHRFDLRPDARAHLQLKLCHRFFCHAG